jgi:hypothetical protein
MLLQDRDLMSVNLNKSPLLTGLRVRAVKANAHQGKPVFELMRMRARLHLVEKVKSLTAIKGRKAAVYHLSE